MTQLIDTLALYGITGNQALIYLGLGFVIFSVLFILVMRLVFWLVRRYLRSLGMLDMSVLAVSLPKFNPDDKDGTGQPKTHQELVEKIAPAEALMASIAGMHAQRDFKSMFFGRTDYYSFEIALKDGLIYFFVAVPKKSLAYMKEQITAQFPAAVVEEEPDYNIFLPQGVIDGLELKFRREYIYPLKTYKEIETDSLSSITNALSSLPEGTGASIQLLTRSAHPRWHTWGWKAATKASQGKRLGDAVKESRRGFHLNISGLLKQFGPPKSEKAELPKEYKLSQSEQDAIKKIEEKNAKGGLEANLRIMVGAKNKAIATVALDNLTKSFSQFNIYQYGNALTTFRPRKSTLINNFIFREFHEKNVIIINAEEAASLFHFPLPHIETPNISWLMSRKVPAPLDTPKEGVKIGYNLYRGRKTPIFFKDSDRRRHAYIIGMTGSGKSKAMVTMIIQDMKAGKGICFIDPLGDDADLIMENIPPERIDDVIIFDPSDYEHPLAMNMLEFQTPDQKIFVVNEVFNIFDKLYDLKATGGPMFEQYMKNAMLLLMEDPESGMTLLEISRVLSDEDFRNYKLSKCQTQVIKNFWEKEATKAGGEASLANMVPYITSKLTPFIANDLMRPIISQQKSSFNFRAAMDSQKIIIVKLLKGKLGDINAYLLGMIVVGKILGAALSRSDTPENDRKDFYLYIDEFQNFLTDSIGTILSEARKYRLCLTVAHQFVGQLIRSGNDTKIRDAVFGNVGTKIVFRVGVDDAEDLAKEFKPVFSEYDLMNQPALNCLVKLLVDNANIRPFNMQSINLKELTVTNPDMVKNAIEMSRLKYGGNRAEIEAEINDRLKKEWKVEGAASADDISLEDLFK